MKPKQGTHKERLGHFQDLVLGQESILVVVVKVEEPSHVAHEIVEHGQVETAHHVLEGESTLRLEVPGVEESI